MEQFDFDKFILKYKNLYDLIFLPDIDIKATAKIFSSVNDNAFIKKNIDVYRKVYEKLLRADESIKKEKIVLDFCIKFANENILLENFNYAKQIEKEMKIDLKKTLYDSELDKYRKKVEKKISMFYEHFSLVLDMFKKAILNEKENEKALANSKEIYIISKKCSNRVIQYLEEAIKNKDKCLEDFPYEIDNYYFSLPVLNDPSVQDNIFLKKGVKLDDFVLVGDSVYEKIKPIFQVTNELKISTNFLSTKTPSAKDYIKSSTRIKLINFLNSGRIVTYINVYNKSTYKDIKKIFPENAIIYKLKTNQKSSRKKIIFDMIFSFRFREKFQRFALTNKDISKFCGVNENNFVMQELFLDKDIKTPVLIIDDSSNKYIHITSDESKCYYNRTAFQNILVGFQKDEYNFNLLSNMKLSTENEDNSNSVQIISNNNYLLNSVYFSLANIVPLSEYFLNSWNTIEPISQPESPFVQSFGNFVYNYHNTPKETPKEVIYDSNVFYDKKSLSETFVNILEKLNEALTITNTKYSVLKSLFCIGNSSLTIPINTTINISTTRITCKFFSVNKELKTVLIPYMNETIEEVGQKNNSEIIIMDRSNLKISIPDPKKKINSIDIAKYQIILYENFQDSRPTIYLVPVLCTVMKENFVQTMLGCHCAERKKTIEESKVLNYPLRITQDSDPNEAFNDYIRGDSFLKSKEFFIEEGNKRNRVVYFNIIAKDSDELKKKNGLDPIKEVNTIKNVNKRVSDISEYVKHITQKESNLVTSNYIIFSCDEKEEIKCNESISFGKKEYKLFSVIGMKESSYESFVFVKSKVKNLSNDKVNYYNNKGSEYDKIKPSVVIYKKI